jgi:probable HAF family extracellular repeat protein
LVVGKSSIPPPRGWLFSVGLMPRSPVLRFINFFLGEHLMRTKSILAVSLFLFCLIPALSMAQTHTVTDLGSLAPSGINAWAQVVGVYKNNAAIWTRATGIRSLGLLSGGTFSSAAAINDLGVVTGVADGPSVVTWDAGSGNCSDLVQPFAWTKATGMRGLGAPPLLVQQFGGPPAACELYVYAEDINDRGTVVASNAEAASYKWGYIWTSKGFTTLDTDFETAANGINNVGQKVVGQTSDGLFLSELSHAAFWVNGVMTELGTLGGDATDLSYSSGANGVNDLDQIVGWSSITAADDSTSCWTFICPPFHAFLLKPGAAMQDLGTLPGDTSSVALKVNLFGQIIGTSGNTVVQQDGVPGGTIQVIGHPFTWSERSGMQDLNTLIRANSGWVLNSVSGINIWGQIVGSGTFNGEPHGFLLTPKEL